MRLEETLAQFGHKIEDITKIYHGKDHNCKCGCAGRYFSREDRGFKLALSKMQKDKFQPLVKGEDMWFSQACKWGTTDGVTGDEIYVNIPYGRESDKCYTLYFG